MTTDLTTLLAEADAVSAAATPGPWKLKRHGKQDYVVGPSTNDAIPSPDIVAEPMSVARAQLSDRSLDDDNANMAFIAASRDLIPRLVAACREQMAEIERLREAMKSVSDMTRNCQHDGGYDREFGPVGCMLGDKCVCIGVHPIARSALQPAGKDTP